MKNLKNLISSLCVVLLVTTSSNLVTAAPFSTNPSSVQEQISAFLQGIDFNTVDEEKTILVDFLISDKNELMILSTNADNMDKLIKAKLNYKKLSSHELDRNKKYSIPIRFKTA